MTATHNSLNEGRGINPGDTSPSARCQDRSAPLNEGRGINPGDTWEKPAVRSCAFYLFIRAPRA